MEKFDPIKHKQEKQRVVKELLNTEIETVWDESGQKLRIVIPLEGGAMGSVDDTALRGHIKKLENEKVAGSEDDTFFYIDDVRVHPMARGKKIGVLLLDKLCEELEKKGIKHIFGVARDESAMNLFAKAFGKDNLVFYKSQYKPTEIENEEVIEGLVDAYLQQCRYVDFGVDISRLEAKKPSK